MVVGVGDAEMDSFDECDRNHSNCSIALNQKATGRVCVVGAN